MNRHADAGTRWSRVLARAAGVAFVTLAAAGASSDAYADPPRQAAQAAPAVVAAPSAAAAPAAPSPSPPAAPSSSAPEAPDPGQGAGPNTARTVAYVGFGVAGAGVVVGTIAGALAISKTSKLRSDCSGTVCPVDKQSDINAAGNLAGLSTVSFALAIFGATAAVVALVVSSDSSKPTTSRSAAVTVRPVVGVGALGFEGSF